MKINKGGVGQFIEKLIGLKNTNALTDFSDGELKTNKADKDSAPLETMFISQISSNFDQLISDQISFEDSWIYQKIKNLLYVPICKVDNNPDKWYNRFQNGRRINIPCEFSIMI
nr:MutH/Sau3AI family endonuclease [Neisseria subflava]